jgi:hypothetical protein
LGNIRIEEVAPAAQTRGRFDSEALLAFKPQARAQLLAFIATTDAAPFSPQHITVHHDRYRYFRSSRRRDDAVLVTVDLRDNPWFPDELDQDKDSDYASDPEMADHVCGGNYEIVAGICRDKTRTALSLWRALLSL